MRIFMVLNSHTACTIILLALELLHGLLSCGENSAILLRSTYHKFTMRTLGTLHTHTDSVEAGEHRGWHAWWTLQN